MTSLTKLHLNQLGFIIGIIQEKYPSLGDNTIRNGLKDLDVAKYKYLLALHYNNKKAELDSELFKLGILN